MHVDVEFHRSPRPLHVGMTGEPSLLLKQKAEARPQQSITVILNSLSPLIFGVLML